MSIPWERNKFVSAKTGQELLEKVYRLQRKGWICMDYSDSEPYSAYLERPHCRPEVTSITFVTSKKVVRNA